MPAACVVEHIGRSGGVVFVVRDGIARAHRGQARRRQRLPVEILSGIGPDDAVVLPSGTPLEDGMRVATGDSKQTNDARIARYDWIAAPSAAGSSHR